MYFITQKEDEMNMSMLRSVEELHYRTKSLGIDKGVFEPTILQISMMEEEYLNQDQINPYVFIDFVKKDETPYLIIYLWIPGLKERYRQLICSPGYRLCEKEEELLVSVCLDKNTGISSEMMFNVIWAYDRNLLCTNIELYSKAPLLSVLHMYFCMFHGIRELLFKAQLPYLAGQIHRADALNLSPVMTKGGPVDLFEKGVTMKMLRLLNSEWGVQELMTEETRHLAVQTYINFHKVLGGYDRISHGQWRYLKDCMVDKEVFQFDLKKFRFFGQDTTDNLFQSYLIFLAKERIINRHVEWYRDPSDPKELQKYTLEADLLLSYIGNKDEYDHLIWMQNSRLEYLDYSDSRYVVTHPSTVMDIFDESVAQHNCLMTVFQDVCRGNLDVGFMRRKNNPEKSFITFQVNECKKVVQIYGKYNRMINPYSNEMRWFRNVYMKEKGFKLSEPTELEDIPFR